MFGPRRPYRSLPSPSTSPSQRNQQALTYAHPVHPQHRPPEDPCALANALKHALFGRPCPRSKSKRRPGLANTPVEVILRIFSFLDTVDTACLALTCKAFHFTFRHLFEEKGEVKFPRLYQLRLQPQLHSETRSRREHLLAFGHVRRDLLRRFQKDSDRMMYCHRCLTLHGRDSFVSPTYHGPVYYRDYCMLEAGVVDLCPCITLSVADREDVVRCLKGLKGLRTRKGGREREAGTGSRLQGNSLQQFEVVPRSKDLVHECHLTCDDPKEGVLIEARIVTTLSIARRTWTEDGSGCRLGKTRDMLIAETEYTVSSDNRVMDWRPNEATGFKDAHYNLLWAMRAAERGALLPRYGPEDGDDDTRREDTLRVERNLGRVGPPVDEIWKKQDRMMSYSFDRLMHAYGY